jgi:hypothetical protein
MLGDYRFQPLGSMRIRAQEVLLIQDDIITQVTL